VELAAGTPPINGLLSAKAFVFGRAHDGLAAAGLREVFADSFETSPGVFSSAFEGLN
jgi:hypothetical protein